MEAGFLFCADPLRAVRTDPVFAAEAALARSPDSEFALLGHEALLSGDTAGALAGVRRGSGPYWYRGWMMPAASYEELARGMDVRGCRLLTDAGSYRRAHELPGWYEEFADVTPRSVWREHAPGTPLSRAELAALAAPLGPGPGIVKDYVKSRKDQWDEACFIPELTDHTRLMAVVDRFLALQEDSLAGGVVLRAYEPFVPGGEVRVWWVDGEPVLTTAHPDTPGKLPEREPGRALDAVAAAVRALGCRFLTTDLALREDGVWRVVEVGDGQVSGAPAGADLRELFAALAEAGATD
ncbi:MULTISPECIES: ATP-grasp domain-containing protein [unclassified Streptomyces]|uniref:ATP-grasp domain-containing protein n=1 Tax=unclassified Streptomyces TaxID=2593676 RepID=UPI002E77254F|nr:ATP-grasp domain-containing protein [Streptomyces sp. JV176]MEE1798902.1 ATP-grasp domain-containing protein [Streptomyces sp. JV176]